MASKTVDMAFISRRDDAAQLAQHIGGQCILTG